MRGILKVKTFQSQETSDVLCGREKVCVMFFVLFYVVVMTNCSCYVFFQTYLAVDPRK